MRILGRRWKDGYLDETRLPGHYRIEVRLWARLGPVEGMYFQRGRDWRLVWNYLNEIGFRQVLRKVVSRRSEHLRNAKYVSVGAGTVLAADADCPVPVGSKVTFLAPCHPPCVERLVLSPELVRQVSASPVLPDTRLRDLSGGTHRVAHDALSHVAGWSPHAGTTLDPTQVEKLLDHADTLLHFPNRPAYSRTRRLGSPVRECDPVEPLGRPGRRTVLYGYGNYAKHVVLPNVRAHLDVVAIHELDPTQLGHRSSTGARRDTSPNWRDSNDHDVALIAGYHHTHAPLAASALRAGATAVVEKPLATTSEQLADLSEALRLGGGSLFACFHKRYSPFNAFAYEDIGCSIGDPISYHCIVYEVPLPPRHWYRWPNSRSRLTSNGCHWLDHFLFLNNYANVLALDARSSQDGEELLASVDLENGAYFTMVLTSKGSYRTGLRNHVELRAGDRQVRILDDSSYISESPRRILRRHTINRMEPYKRMYDAIAKAAVARHPGEYPNQIEASTCLALGLEEDLSRNQ